MDTVINTGRTGFVMLSRLVDIGPDHIQASALFTGIDDQVHSVLETLAQTGALHVRYLAEFKKHAFLLNIDRYHEEPGCVHTGEGIITGRLASRSNRAFAYDLSLTQTHRPMASGRFLFALQDYGARFDQQRIETHYRNLFLCLKNV